MTKHLRYAGEFLSRAGIVWRVEILQDASKAFDEVGELTFEADDPLLIEWSRVEKQDPVSGSIATLKIESPGDRTYEDLYTIAPGRIRMDVYREGKLYWSGALDPEFYEEPYERAANYPVSLTFSDFGILDRLKYDLSGMRTLKEIIEYALGKSVIKYEGIEYDALTTTYFDDSKTKADISRISVRSDNFYDEEGEASTLREVLDGILQPLALHLVQRNGKIYIYDLNGLYKHAVVGQIEWDGSSSTMGTDRVYNNAKVNFSPYSSSELLSEDITFDDPYSNDQTNLDDYPKADGEYYSYYPDYGEDHKQGSSWDYDLVNFTIFLGKGEGLAYLNPKATYFHILPMVGGPAECDGVVWGFYTGGHGSLSSKFPVRKYNAMCKAKDTVLMRTNKVFIPKLSEEDRKRFMLRLSLEMLLDPRYNPFSNADDKKHPTNEDKNFEIIKNNTSWAFVPIAVTVYDGNGNALCHYDNSGIAKYATSGMIGCSRGDWKAGAPVFGDAWLEYYNVNDQKNETGILGWKTNRQTIGRPDTVARCNPDDYKSTISSFKFFDSFKQMADGQYIPYPPDGGYLEVTVYAGVNCYGYKEPPIFSNGNANFEITLAWDNEGLYEVVRWLLYKAPKLEIVKNNLVFDEAELDDIEYSGYINADAQEEISINTICGTASKVSPTAKGVYFRSSDDLQLQKLTRGGVTDHPEQLLIGTLYSQFADRKTTLEGECRLDPSGVKAYSEINQGEKKFLIAGETQNAIADTTEATFIEFRPDEYEAEK